MVEQPWTPPSGVTSGRTTMDASKWKYWPMFYVFRSGWSSPKSHWKQLILRWSLDLCFKKKKKMQAGNDLLNFPPKYSHVRKKRHYHYIALLVCWWMKKKPSSLYISVLMDTCSQFHLKLFNKVVSFYFLLFFQHTSLWCGDSQVGSYSTVDKGRTKVLHYTPAGAQSVQQRLWL